MLLEAIYHRPKQNWAYAYDGKTIHLRIRTKRHDVERAEVVYGDKYLPWEQMCTKEMHIVGHDELFDYWHVEVEPPYRRLSYGFKLHAGENTIWLTERTLGKEAPTQHLGNYEFPFLNPADVFTPPAWVKDAIFYQIFPERFANGDPSNDPEGVEPWGGQPTPTNFFGGDLQGVINHLDYIGKLGVNAIYFTPVFEATTNHKYDTQDYKKVDPHFGTNETLKELVKECHARGIRVLLDAVFNHSGRTFAPFVDVMEKGADSPYANWFYVREYPLRVVDGVPTYETFAFEPKMPKLNTENPEVKAYLLDVARYWIEEVGIDGWRLDVANEVDHQFWREFRKVVKSVNPEAYILGELFHEGMTWLQGDQFDALMNYPFTGAVLDFFVNGKNDGAEFAGKMYGQLFRYPHQANEVTFNLLDSHDTERLLTLCEGDVQKMKLAALFQLTFLGAPCIYYGDEIGLTGSHDPDCRKCMPWDESEYDMDLLGFYQRTIALRHQYSSLRTGSFQFLYAKEDDTRIAYERQDDESHFIIAMNVKKKERAIQLAIPVGEWVDEISGARIISTGKKISKTILSTARSEQATDIAFNLERIYEFYNKSSNGKFVDAPFLTNHDQNRVMSEMAGNVDHAKMAAAILLTLPGNPFFYYGEEIGMTGMKPDERIREPMIWSDEKDAGQTTWEPFFYNKDSNIAVSKQLQDPNSLLQHYKLLIKWRNDLPALHNGDIASYKIDNTSVLAYQRVSSEEKVLVVHNLSKNVVTVTLPDSSFTKLAFKSKIEAKLSGTTLDLPPYSSVILQ